MRAQPYAHIVFVFTEQMQILLGAKGKYLLLGLEPERPIRAGR